MKDEVQCVHNGKVHCQGKKEKCVEPEVVCTKLALGKQLQDTVTVSNRKLLVNRYCKIVTFALVNNTFVPKRGEIQK